ncbi:hypothetical protein ACH5BF_08380 [Arcobacter sp. YIC-464]|uniref:hypothetical protein n=1 Tax=Arcobacter sp. YIC-464 TaxID=3376631 RepID=UPI003C21EE36
MKDAHVHSVGSVAPGFFGAFFDAYQVFSAKTNYEKGKTVAGALTSAGTGFAYGLAGGMIGTSLRPGFGTIVGGATGTVAGALAGKKMGEDFYDSAFSDYKDEINSW